MEQSIEIQNLPLREGSYSMSDRVHPMSLTDRENSKLNSQGKPAISDRSAVTGRSQFSGSVNLSDAIERNDVPLRTRTILLLSFLAASFFENADSGIMPPAILVIQEDLQISNKEIAILNGVTFLVCGVLTITTGPLMLRFEARSVLITCALLYTVGLVTFVSCTDFNLLVFGRALCGVS